MPRNPNCARCVLHENAQHVCIWGNGNPHAEIFLIGQAPGAEENRVGLPFQGPAGRVLDQALTKAGLKRADVYTSNIARCFPPEDRIPTPAEQRACFPYLIEELEAVKPKVVVALGGAAVKALAGRDSIARARGMFLEPTKGVRLNGAKLIGTYHPAAYLHSRNPMMLAGLIEDLTFAAKTAEKSRKPKERLPENIATSLCPGYTSDELREALSALSEAAVVAVDCEWTWNPQRRLSNGQVPMCWPWTKGAELFSIALSGRVGKVVQSVGMAMPLGEGCHTVLTDFLRGRRLVFHNAMADLIWLLPLKLPLRLSGDTMLLAHLFNETAELKLATLAETWLGIENWKQPLWERRPQTVEGWLALLKYNISDTHATLLLLEKLEERLRSLPELERTDISRLYRNLSLPSVIMFARMALRGMPLSLDKVKSAIPQQERILGDYVGAFASEIDRKPEQALELACSPAQVKRFLRESLGIEADTTSAAVMDELADEYPFCTQIQLIKHQVKLLGTYLRPWARMLEEQGDERLHSVYSITRTVTGRTAAEVELGASIQLVPRGYSLFGDESWLRALFEAPEGYVIDSIDFSALEMRMAALAAGERTLLGLFQQGFDPHRYLASKITGHAMDDEEYWKSVEGKKARQDAKPAGFGFLYGQQADGFRKVAKANYGINFTLERAEEIRHLFFETYNDFPAWYRRCEQQFQKGFVRTLFGRYRRTLPDSNKVSNTEVQTPATELTMACLIELDTWLGKHPELHAELVAFVHDDGKILRPADPEIGAVIRAKALEIFRNPPTWKLGVEQLGVTLDAEMKSGRWWGAEE